MEKVPVMLECAYCIRSRSHGGECTNDRNRNNGCLAFKLDPRGCIRDATGRLSFPLFYDIPPENVWDDNWTVHGKDSQIRIDHIYAIKWDKTKGYLIIHCRYSYFINEFDEEVKKNKDRSEMKAKLKVIK
jgi:hypothetical protein